MKKANCVGVNCLLVKLFKKAIKVTEAIHPDKLSAIITDKSNIGFVSKFDNIANIKLLDEDNMPPIRRTKKTLNFIAKTFLTNLLES